MKYICPFCKTSWSDRGEARESFVCPGCGAGPNEYAKYVLGTIKDIGRLDWLDKNSTHAIADLDSGNWIIRGRRGHDEPINVRKVIDNLILNNQIKKY